MNEAAPSSKLSTEYSHQWTEQSKIGTEIFLRKLQNITGIVC